MDTSTSSAGFHDRRIHARRQTSSLAYVDLGEDNGGLVLNMSEGGLAVHAAVMLTGDHLPKIRFQLPQSQDWIESAGQITWTGDSRKNAGIEFVGLPEEARTLIRNWLASSEPAYQPPSVRRRTVDARRLAALATLPAETVPAHDVKATASPRAGIATVPAEGAKTNGSGDSVAAGESIARPTPIEIGTSPAPSTESRPRRWAIHPTFTQEAPAAATQTIIAEPRHNWSLFLAAWVLMVAASFAFGLITGRGAWSGIFATARNLVVGKSASVAPEAGSNVPENESAPSDAGVAKSASNSAAQSTAPISAAHDAHGQSAGATFAQSQGGASPAQSVIVHRPASSKTADGASTSGDDNSGTVLSMPDTPVSASSSVAVSSRLYIPVPAAAGTPGSQQRAGNVQIGRLESRAEIVYPPDAEAQRVEGIVKLHVAIGADGTIQSAAPMSGAPLLAAAALDAVRQWRYKPTTMDGSPIETEADITVVFRLPQAPQ